MIVDEICKFMYMNADRKIGEYFSTKNRVNRGFPFADGKMVIEFCSGMKPDSIERTAGSLMLIG